MSNERSEAFGFAPAHDAPIPYMQRIRDYYVTLGYGAPYEWAHYAEVPFQPLGKKLEECRVAIVTTAAPYQPDKGDQGPGAPYNSAAKFYQVYSGDTARDHDLRISHVGIDRKYTTAEDPGTWFPLPALRAAAKQGRIGELARRFHGLPTNRSHRVTLEVDCPEIVARCKEDRVDAALLLPNCPVCHQSASLAARALEAAGIATVVMGCAKDIVEYVGVPRLLFLRFSARQCGGATEGPAIAGVHAGAGVEGAGDRAGRPHHRAVAAGVERQPGLEARLPERGAHVAGGDRAPPRRVRQAEAGGHAPARGPGAAARQGPGHGRTRRKPAPHDPALRRRPHPRLHAGVRRALRQLPAGAAGRRRHQDRAPRRRRHAARAPQQGVGGAQPRHRLPGDQRQQAHARARSHQAQGDRDRQAAGREDRRGDGELSPRRDGQARARLRDTLRAQSAADLLRGLRLRAERSGAHDGCLRRQDPGHERHHVGHRLCRDAGRCGRGLPCATPSAA